MAAEALQTVLLRHDLPDGTHHFDWFIQRLPEPGSPLRAFRVRDRIDGPGLDRFEAEPIGDHRPVYLDYEGPVSGGRGRVRREASGVAEVEETLDLIRVLVRWGAGHRSEWVARLSGTDPELLRFEPVS